MTPSDVRRRRRRAAAAPYLSINNIEVIYDHVILVLKGVSLGSAARAGSSRCSARTAPARRTTLKAISNLLRAERGDVTKGTIEFEGKRVDRLTTERARPDGRVPGDGRPALLLAPDGRGEPADRRVHAHGDRARESARDARHGLSLFSAPEGSGGRASRATRPAASSR